MAELARVESGQWQHDTELGDYRAEWLTDVLVERATLRPNSAQRTLGPELAQEIIGEAGYVWARFWFRKEGWVVDKYFSQLGRTIGYLTPICGPIDQGTGRLSATVFGLRLWIADSGRVTVLGEGLFDKMVEEGVVTPVVAEEAEQRIRELTTLIAQRRYPPAFVRNFGILLG